MKKIPIEVSARHCHLSKKDFETLFGQQYQLTKLKDLSQPGQFAAKEVVTIVGPKGKIENVRIVGPFRSQTQVEISKTDGFILGLHPPLRVSGDLKGSPGVTICGPKGKINLKEGLIVAMRHLHISPEEAQKIQIKNGEIVSIKVEGKRGLIFNNVVVRVDKDFRLAFQIDTDEANAAGIEKKGWGVLIK